MNKKLLESIFPEEKGKWFFTRLQLNRPLQTQDSTGLVLEFEMNLPGNSLIRTRINSRGLSIGSIYFSAVRQ